MRNTHNNRSNQKAHNKNYMKDTELCLHFLDFITRGKNILNSFRQLTYVVISI